MKKIYKINKDGSKTLKLFEDEGWVDGMLFDGFSLLQVKVSPIKAGFYSTTAQVFLKGIGESEMDGEPLLPRNSKVRITIRVLNGDK